MLKVRSIPYFSIRLFFLLTWLVVAPLSAQGQTNLPLNTPTAVTISTAGQNAELTFSGTAGEVVNVWATSSTFSGCYSLQISILKPDGSNLANTNLCNSAVGGLSLVTLPATGTYTVLVAPQNAQTGSVNITLSNELTGTSLALNTTTPVTISTPGQDAELTFSGTAGEVVNVWATSSTFSGCYSLQVAILKPDGSNLASTNLCVSAVGGLSLVTLPTTGTYTVLVAPQNAQTGSVNITLSNELTGTSLALNTTTPVTISTPGQDAELTFSGTAGEVVNVWATSSTFSGCYSLQVAILKPDGSNLASTNLCVSAVGGLSLVTLPTTGTYTVLVAPQNAQTGSVNITLSNELTGTSLALNTTTPVTISTPGQDAELTFSGTAGEVVNVWATSSTFSGCYSLQVSILKPDGSNLANTNLCVSTVGGLSLVTLPTTGTYTVLLAPQNAQTGSVNITLSNELTGTNLALNTTTPVTISAPGQDAELTFSGTAGQVVNVWATNSTFSGCYSLQLSILKPDGSNLANTNLCYNTVGGVSLVTLPTTGTYTVLVAPQNAQTGSVNITLSNELTGTLANSVVQPVTIGLPGQVAELNFLGTVGATGTVAVTNSVFAGCPSLIIKVVNPDGSTLTSTNMCGGSGSTSQFTLSMNGSYTVMLIPQNGVTGSANIELSFSNPTPTPTLSLASGTYYGVENVTISDAESVSTLYYTTDGTTPTNSSSIYTGPIAVTSTETLKAIAIAPGYAPSNVVTASYTVMPPGAVKVYLSPPGAQNTTVAGAATETFDALSTGIHTSAYVSTAGIGTYTGSSTNPFAILPPDVFGGAIDSTSNTPTNYLAEGNATESTSPVVLHLAQPAAYFGFWWSAGDAENRVALYSNGTLYGTFSTADLLSFLNQGAGTITATNGSSYQTSAYFGNPNLSPGSNDGGEPFAYVSFVITGTSIDTIVFYNTGTSTAFESDNHSVIFAGNTVTIPTTYVPVESLSLTPQVAQPVFSPSAGTYATTQTVTISSSTPGASINYTTDGTTPTSTTGILYSHSLTVEGSETIKAIAYSNNGMTDSIVSSAAYVIPLTVTVAPGSASLNSSGTQQFTATVVGSSNTAVTWSVSPAGSGSIDALGNYIAPNVTSQQTVTVTATSQADATKFASATITLLPSCGSNGYSYVRSIVIDHTKVSNTDQVNFPFFVSITDPSLKSVANGGHVSSSGGNDIVFSADPKGLTKFDHEIEQYNPATGQVLAWVRIPTVSHTVDTVVYLFYGNPSVTSSQQNPTGVWDSNYVGVWHLPNGATLSVNDSTAGANNGTVSGATATTGKIGGGASFNGSSYISINPSPTVSAPFTIEEWVYPTSNGSTQGIFGSRSSSDHSFDAKLTGSGLQGDIGNGSSWLTLNAGAPFSETLNVWHHIAYVVSATGYSIFADGGQVGSGSLGGTALLSDSSHFLDFGWTGFGNEYLSGALDEIRVSSSTRSPDWIATEFANQSSPSSFYLLNPETTVSVYPASASLYTSQNIQFNATALGPGSCAPPVTWSLPAGSPGTVSSSGLYSAPSTISAQQNVTIIATNTSDTTKTGTAVVTLLPAPENPRLVLVAPVLPPYVAGSTQQFSATLTNQDGTAISGVAVAFSVTGANTTSGSPITNQYGVATFSYSGTNGGADTIRAITTVNGWQVDSSPLTVSWIAPANPISTTTVLGQFFPFTSTNGYAFNASPANTPAFTQVFPAINFNPPSGVIPGNTAIGVSTHPFTDVTLDENGNFSGTIVAQGNGYQAGTVGGPLGPFQAVFTGSYVVANGGDAVITVYADNTFMLGIGGGATRVSGPINSSPTVTPFEQFPVVGASPINNTIGGSSITVHFPGPGTYPYELDYVECCGYGGADTLSLMMMAGTPNGAGLAVGVNAGATLTLSPGLVQPLPVGGQQSFTVVAADASGNPVPNLNVSLIVSQNDTLELSALTNSSGMATFNYKSTYLGIDSVQAVALISGLVAYSNQVSVPWTLPASTVTSNPGSSGSLSVSISAQNTLILPSNLQLTGTAIDSALPQGDSISLAWSKVSGPGNVTFANSQQASTSASFTAAGSYQLQLAATDVNGSASTQITVAVNPPPGVSQGWIGTPAYGAAVSGIVPIRVAAGVTLTSGVLTIYPANNPNAVTILNSATTGSGQIGTLDTTTLNNGTYWITLQATNSSGSSEYNLALVTVVGNNKPGRVTTTITDLVIPANGLPINIQRTYDSLKASTPGDFGYGWNLGTTVNLVVSPNGSVTFTLGGIRRTFYLTPQFLGWVFPYYVPAYTAEPGFHGTLTSNGTGCSDEFDFLAPDGSLWVCTGGGGLFNPTAYTYTDPAGTSYLISATGNLQSIVDKNGNQLIISSGGITSSTGLSIPFTRDASGRITDIVDPQNNDYHYQYDGNGNLASVTYPNTALSSTYTYDSNHHYLSGTDFNGNSLPTAEYYNPSDTDPNGLPLNGRLKSVTTSPSSGTTYTTSYAYNLSVAALPNTPNYNLVTNSTTITYPADAGGSVGTATLGYNSVGDVITSTDPNGLTTTNGYDLNRNLTSVTDPMNRITSYTYDSSGNRTSVTYPNPASSTVTNTTSYVVYNQFGEPTQTTDELNNVRTFNYDVNFNPQSVTDSLGILASFAFNTNGTIQLGAVGYDIGVQPAMGSQFTYDANGNMTSKTDALGRTTSYTYDSLGHKLTMTQPAIGGSTPSTTYQYDAFGHLTQTSAPLGRTTSSQYDANGNKISDTDARSNTTTYQYDALNRLILTTYPTSPSTTSSTTYDFRGNPINQTNQAGHVTHNQYDLAGRLISVTKAYGTSNAATTAYTYDNAGRKISETDALGHVTTYSYDAAGNLISIAGVKGNFQYGYDNARNQISVTDGNAHTTHFQYDARKRLVLTTYPDATTKVNTYDAPGNLTGVTDQAGHTINYTYDAANQLQTVIQSSHPDPAHHTTAYGYDPLGNLTSSTDANTHATLNSFDLVSELTTKTLPDGSLTETRSYDAAGNVISLTHFNGKITTYAYDNLNRLLSRTPDSTLGEPTVSFTYTATGKRATMTDASGTTVYSYDSMDRLSSKATPQGTLSYTYDAAGNLASMASSNANGVSVSYTYDTLNRLSTVVDSRASGGTATTSYSYDPASNLATAQYQNGLQTTLSYDALNRLTALTTPNSGYLYTLEPTGNRTNATELTGRSLTWSYDGIDRLTNETISLDPASKNGSVSYGLDPVGNRLSASSTVPGVSSGTFGFDADDRLTSETYDSNGNVLTTGGKTFAYDSENQLKSMNGSAVTLVYDGDGNRVAKTVGGVTTHYLVDDLNPTRYAQVVEEVVNGAVQREYAYGLQRISQSQLVGSTWTTSYYSYDGMGSVRQLTNSAGAVTDTYDYDAFGSKVNSTGTTPNNYLYRGEQYDSDLGLYYLRARYYNPLTGRFLSRDPEAGKPVDPKTLHKYLYASGDPLNHFDPSGRDDEVEIASLLAGETWQTKLELRAVAFTVKVLLCFDGAEAFILQINPNFYGQSIDALAETLGEWYDQCIEYAAAGLI